MISYIMISFAFVILYFYSDFSPIEFTSIIICITVFDSACYIIGKKFGRNKIIINISPNKTYEGLFGGVLTTNAVCLLMYFNVDLSKIEYNLFIFANLVIFF